MKPAPREPVILVVRAEAHTPDEPQELAGLRARGWRTWTLTESAVHPPKLREDDRRLSLRVRSVHAGAGLERGCLAAFRALAPWVAIWFPDAGPCPSEQEMDLAAAASEEAHLVLAANPQGKCRYLCLAAPIALLFHDLEWQLSPPVNALVERALEAGASVYSLPSSD
jgi:hypothetical protein